MPMGFLELRNRYIIEGKLKLESALHVGCGIASPQTDSPFLRDSKGLMVPGSSVRGVMRSTLERLLQTLAPGKGCVLFGPPECHPTCFTVHEQRFKVFEAVAERLAKGSSSKLEQTILRKLLKGNGQCWICRLFGSPYLASKIRIGDARVNGCKTNVRDGVGIDRDTETAREHIKYDFEVAEPVNDQVTLALRIELENAMETDFALLHILLCEMKEPGMDIGGKKSRGLGRCRLNQNLTVKYFEGRESLQRFLNGQPDALEAEAFRKMLEQSFQACLQGGG